MSINSVVLSGRMVADPELRYTSSGKAVANFTIAVDDGWGDNKKTYFPKLVAWTHTAEYVAQYGKKGMQVTVQGKYTENTWESDDKKKHKEAVILVSDVVLQSKGINTNESSQTQATSQNTSSQGHSNQNDNMYGEEILFDDNDLPF
jgi:single-strand DNA-binding protein